MATIINEFPEGYESNLTWGGNGGDVADLPVWSRLEQPSLVRRSVSAWKLSEEELEEVKRTGVIYLSVFGVHPPVLVHTASEFEFISSTAPFYPQPVQVYVAMPINEVIGAVKDTETPNSPHRVGLALPTDDGWTLLN